MYCTVITICTSKLCLYHTGTGTVETMYGRDSKILDLCALRRMKATCFLLSYIFCEIAPRACQQTPHTWYDSGRGVSARTVQRRQLLRVSCAINRTLEGKHSFRSTKEGLVRLSSCAMCTH